MNLLSASSLAPYFSLVVFWLCNFAQGEIDLVECIRYIKTGRHQGRFK